MSEVRGAEAAVCLEPITASPSTGPHDPSRTSPAAGIAARAHAALVAEVMLTPKPGLVDCRNTGAHRDMDLNTFLASANAIAPWWPRFVRAGHASAHVPAPAVLPLVRPIGVQCEDAMREATHGVNTHKGAIFSMGLLCAAAGRLLGRDIPLTRQGLCAEVGRISAGIVARELNGRRGPRTAGERIFMRHGLTGARGEAAAGFALVRMVALPVYDRLRRDGVDEETTLLHVLLHLLAVNGDTNLVSRGGMSGLTYVQSRARRLLKQGGALADDAADKLAAFDDALIARRLSPGGSADLLAVTWFLSRLTSPTSSGR